MNNISHIIKIGLFMDITQFKGPVLVTISYFLVYYFFIYLILKTRIKLHSTYKKEGKKFDRYFSQDRKMLLADRTQLNMLEHAPAFLSLMWIYAIFVSTNLATIMGSFYVATRSLYPFVMGKKIGRDIPKRILFVTFSNYLVIIFFIVSILKKLLMN